jgi:hypothetical protein
MRTAIGRAGANGTVDFRRLGETCSFIMLLRMTVGSQSEHQAISLARSVTISDIAHHVGGLGDPPNVSRNDT